MHSQTTLTSPNDSIQSHKLPDHFFIPNEANQKARLLEFPSLRAEGEAIQKSNTQIESIGSLPLIVGY